MSVIENKYLLLVVGNTCEVRTGSIGKNLNGKAADEFNEEATAEVMFGSGERMGDQYTVLIIKGCVKANVPENNNNNSNYIQNKLQDHPEQINSTVYVYRSVQIEIYSSFKQYSC